MPKSGTAVVMVDKTTANMDTYRVNTPSPEQAVVLLANKQADRLKPAEDCAMLVIKPTGCTDGEN